MDGILYLNGYFKLIGILKEHVIPFWHNDEALYILCYDTFLIHVTYLFCYWENPLTSI